MVAEPTLQGRGIGASLSQGRVPKPGNAGARPQVSGERGTAVGVEVGAVRGEVGIGAGGAEVEHRRGGVAEGLPHELVEDAEGLRREGVPAILRLGSDGDHDLSRPLRGGHGSGRPAGIRGVDRVGGGVEHPVLPHAGHLAVDDELRRVIAWGPPGTGRPGSRGRVEGVEAVAERTRRTGRGGPRTGPAADLARPIREGRFQGTSRELSRSSLTSIGCRSATWRRSGPRSIAVGSSMSLSPRTQMAGPTMTTATSGFRPAGLAGIRRVSMALVEATDRLSQRIGRPQLRRQERPRRRPSRPIRDPQPSQPGLAAGRDPRGRRRSADSSAHMEARQVGRRVDLGQPGQPAGQRRGDAQAPRSPGGGERGQGDGPRRRRGPRRVSGSSGSCAILVVCGPSEGTRQNAEKSRIRIIRLPGILCLPPSNQSGEQERVKQIPRSVRIPTVEEQDPLLAQVEDRDQPDGDQPTRGQPQALPWAAGGLVPPARRGSTTTTPCTGRSRSPAGRPGRGRSGRTRPLGSAGWRGSGSAPSGRAAAAGRPGRRRTRSGRRPGSRPGFDVVQEPQRRNEMVKATPAAPRRTGRRSAAWGSWRDEQVTPDELRRAGCATAPRTRRRSAPR